MQTLKSSNAAFQASVSNQHFPNVATLLGGGRFDGAGMVELEPPAGGPPPGTFRINGESVEPGKGPLKPPKLTGKKAKKAKIAKQRAGSAGESGVRSTGKAIADQAVRVEMARRGDKQVTMVRGLETPAEDRKALLKLLKSKIGVGGTLDKASGIIEIQGPHGAKVTELLVKAGYSSAKQSGKKK